LLANSELVFGVLGVINFSNIDPGFELFVRFIWPLGPFFLITKYYRRWAIKQQINVDTAAFITLLLLGTLGTLAFFPNPAIDPYYPGQYRLGKMIFSTIFALVGLIGSSVSVYRSIRHSGAAKVTVDAKSEQKSD